MALKLKKTVETEGDEFETSPAERAAQRASAYIDPEPKPVDPAMQDVVDAIRERKAAEKLQEEKAETQESEPAVQNKAPDPEEKKDDPEQDQPPVDPLAPYRQLMDGLSDKDREELEKRAREEANLPQNRFIPQASAAPGNDQGAPSGQPLNAVDSLVNLAAAPLIGAGMGLAHGIRKFKSLINERSGQASGFSTETVRDRIFDLKMSSLRENAVGMVTEREALDQRIADFNEAYLSSASAAKVRNLAEAKGLPVEDLLRQVSEGSAKSDEVEAAREVMDDAKVSAAWKGVLGGISAIAGKEAAARRDLEQLANNFQDRFDAAKEIDGLQEAADIATKDLSQPVFEDPETKQKVREQLKELADRIVKWAKEFIEKLLNALRGQGPEPK